MSSDCDLVNNLVVVEWDVSHDVGAVWFPLAFALLFGNGELVDVSAR